MCETFRTSNATWFIQNEVSLFRYRLFLDPDTRVIEQLLKQCNVSLELLDVVDKREKWDNIRAFWEKQDYDCEKTEVFKVMKDGVVDYSFASSGSGVTVYC